jgi:prepilin-type N-terminal cleavage/methylation domain-containing protein
MKTLDPGQADGRERGFTLIETLIAMVVLTFGLIAITNLLLVGATSSTVANHSTAAATEASAVMEKLKALSFNSLVQGNDLAVTAPSACDADTQDCVTPNNFNSSRTVPGVGRIEVRWAVTPTDVSGPPTRFIQVRAWSEGALAGARSRTDLTAFRSCTLGTPPCNP